MKSSCLIESLIVAGLLCAAFVFFRLALRVDYPQYAIVLLSGSAVTGTAALRPQRVRSCLADLSQLRFKLRTAFLVMFTVCATCALAPELRDYLVVFFTIFFSLVIMGER
ncbi:MAG TPA: hypothetical protein VG826_24030 [Pirellulales bacterium]|nr:hypothetical protein [Pirellulales bacterium]